MAWEFAEAYPGVTVDAEGILVQDGAVWTSAGDPELSDVSSLLHDLNLEHPTPGRQPRLEFEKHE